MLALKQQDRQCCFKLTPAMMMRVQILLGKSLLLLPYCHNFNNFPLPLCIFDDLPPPLCRIQHSPPKAHFVNQIAIKVQELIITKLQALCWINSAKTNQLYHNYVGLYAASISQSKLRPSALENDGEITRLMEKQNCTSYFSSLCKVIASFIFYIFFWTGGVFMLMCRLAR